MKTILLILTIITLCSFGDNKKHKLQRRQGILIETKKGFEFIPLEQWQDYKPKRFGDTLYQFKTI